MLGLKALGCFEGCHVSWNGLEAYSKRMKNKVANHMCVEVEDCDWLAVGFLQGSKSWKGNGVVAAEGDQFRMDMRYGVRVRQWPP